MTDKIHVRGPFRLHVVSLTCFCCYYIKVSNSQTITLVTCLNVTQTDERTIYRCFLCKISSASDVPAATVLSV